MIEPPSMPKRIVDFTAGVTAFNAQAREVGAAIPKDADRNSNAVRDQVLPLYATGANIAKLGADLATAVTDADLNQLPKEARAAYRDALTAATNNARTVAQETRVGLHRHQETTASAAESHSAQSKAVWDAARQGKDLPNMRIYGTIKPDDAAFVIDRLDNVPARIIATTDALGKRHVQFSGKPTDVWGFHTLRGKKYGDDRTFDQLPGFAWKKGYLADPSRELPGPIGGHGEKSLTLHEYGHIVDSAIAAPKDIAVSLTQSWNEGPQVEAKSRSALKPYFKNQPWEWFAESFMRYTRTPQTHASLARWYPKTFAALKPILGPAQFRKA